MGTEEVELDYLEFFYKFNERLYIIMASVSNGTEISEADYAVLEEVYRIWDSGRIPFHKIISTESETTTTQADLFCQNVSSTAFGTQVDIAQVNTKTKKDEPKKIQK